jgi:hypothetical protein
MSFYTIYGIHSRSEFSLPQIADEVPVMHMPFNHLVFSGDFRFSTFIDCTFSNCVFSDSDLLGVTFKCCKFIDCMFRGARMTRATQFAYCSTEKMKLSTHGVSQVELIDESRNGMEFETAEGVQHFCFGYLNSTKEYWMNEITPNDFASMSIDNDSIRARAIKTIKDCIAQGLIGESELGSNLDILMYNLRKQDRRDLANWWSDNAVRILHP